MNKLRQRLEAIKAREGIIATALQREGHRVERQLAALRREEIRSHQQHSNLSEGEFHGTKSITNDQ